MHRVFFSNRHLAATGGAWRVTNWLLHNNVDVNALDGFGRTPLDDALKAGHGVCWAVIHGMQRNTHCADMCLQQRIHADACLPRGQYLCGMVSQHMFSLHMHCTAEVAELLADSGARVVVDGHMVAPGMVMKLALASGRSRADLHADKPVVTVPPGMA